MEWPAWREENIAISQNDGDDSELERNRKQRPAEYTYPANRTKMKGVIKALHNGHPRYDPVLISCPDREARTTRITTMTGRRVAQVMLLFKYRQQQGATRGDGALWHELAFVQWFSTKQNAEPDKGPGLYLVGRTTRYSVIPIHTIERPVHLIPKFGSELDSTTSIYRQIQKNLDEFKWFQTENSLSKKEDGEINRSDSSPQRICDKPLDALAFYTDFNLNSWVDRHGYENIF
jgi:hypothetical protein